MKAVEENAMSVKNECHNCLPTVVKALKQVKIGTLTMFISFSQISQTESKVGGWTTMTSVLSEKHAFQVLTVISTCMWWD